MEIPHIPLKPLETTHWRKLWKKSKGFEAEWFDCRHPIPEDVFF